MAEASKLTYTRQAAGTDVALPPFVVDMRNNVVSVMFGGMRSRYELTKKFYDACRAFLTEKATADREIDSLTIETFAAMTTRKAAEAQPPPLEQPLGPGE